MCCSESAIFNIESVTLLQPKPKGQNTHIHLMSLFCIILVFSQNIKEIVLHMKIFGGWGNAI